MDNFSGVEFQFIMLSKLFYLHQAVHVALSVCAQLAIQKTLSDMSNNLIVTCNKLVYILKSMNSE